MAAASADFHDPVKTLCISGGTHGDELHGVYLVKNWLKTDCHCHEIKRSSFRTHTVLCNPRATEKCVRYLDVDLNRQLTPENIFSSEEQKGETPYEVKRARELYFQFQDDTTGGKGVDFWLDLHNTTANMGPCFILTHSSPFSLHIAAHVQSEFPEIHILELEGIFEKVVFKNEQQGREAARPQVSTLLTGSVSSLGKEGFALEVGPLSHGTLNATMYNFTKEIICCLLDAVEEFNRGREFEEKAIEVFKFLGPVHYSSDAEGEISAILYPDLNGKDWKPLNPGDPLFLSFSGEVIPFQGDHTVWPVFINEAVYFRNKIALAVTMKQNIVIPSVKAKLI